MAEPIATDEEEGWLPLVLLGLVTITAYGSWFYGFGVLVGPIAADTGWGTGVLGLTFGIAQMITGAGGFVAGRLLDRVGGRGPLLVQAVGGGGLLLAATWARTPVQFVLVYSVGAGITGATGFYPVTTVIASRIHARRPDRAIAVLTMIGAFCSPIYLPLTAWMVSGWHWRVAGRILALTAIGGAIAAAAIVRGGASGVEGPSERPWRALRAAVTSPAVRTMLLVYMVAGMAFGSVLVYQVPVMVAGGLTLGTAGVVGGFRGFCQIFGRVGLAGAIRRAGARNLLVGAYAASAFGVLLLLVDQLWAALAFAVLAGIGLGATSPLQAIYSRTRFEEGDLGLLMGLQGAAVGVAGGVGPFVGGVLHDLTDSWNAVVILCGAALSGAAILLARPVSEPPRPVSDGG